MKVETNYLPPLETTEKTTEKKRNSLRGISRIEQLNKKNYCWWVRLNYEKTSNGKRGKPKIQKLFYDSFYGGKEEALKAAIKFRDEQIKNLPVNKSTVLFSWKDRDRKTRREIQEAVGFKTIKTGTGIEGAKKAYELGACKVSVFKIRTGRQDSFSTNHGGWHTPRFEDKQFKREVTVEDERKIRNLVNLNAPELAPVEKSEIVGEILICQSINDKPVTDTNIKRMIREYQGYFEKRKNKMDQRVKYVPDYKDYQLYEETELEEKESYL